MHWCWTRGRAWWAGLAIAWAAASWGWHCGGVTSVCESDADCSELAASDPAFVGTRCVEGSCSEGSAGEGDTGGGAEASACVSNRQCVADHGSAGWLCLEPGHPCTALTSEDCTTVYGDTTADDVIVFGHLLPLTGGFAFLGPPGQNASEQALSEVGELELTSPNGEALRFGVQVSCDEAADPVRAAKFLVEEVGVEIIIGGLNQETAVTLAQQVTLEAGVLLITPAGGPAIAGLDHGGLVLSLAADRSARAPAAAAVIEEMEATARAKQGLSSTDPVRLCLLASDGSEHAAAREALLNEPSFTFNGQSWQQNGNDFCLVSYPDPAEEPVDWASVASQIVDAQPDLLVAFGGPELAIELVEPIEAAWPAGAARPEWLVPRLAPDVFAQPEDRRLRTRSLAPLGISPSDDGPAWLGSRYEAVYATTYAYLAAGERASGQGLSEELIALGNPPGLEVTVGPEDFDEALQALTAEMDIDARGVTSSLDFNPDTGLVVETLGVFCVAAQSHQWVSAGQTFVGGALEGTFSCP